MRVCLAATVSVLAIPAQAADFSKAKRVYVAPTSYTRRIDFAAMREQITVPTSSKPKVASLPPAKKPASPAKIGGKTPTAVKDTPHPPPLPNTALHAKSIAGAGTMAISPQHLAKMKAAAAELVASGKLDEAHRVMQKVSQLSPHDKALAAEVATLSMKRARQHLDNNNVHDALLSARAALAADPGNAEAHKVLSAAHDKSGIDSHNVTHRLKVADNLYAQGKYAEAEVEYHASLKVKPTAEAHIGLAKTSEKLRGAVHARAHLEKALEVDSSSAAAHRELGHLHFKANDLVGANSELSRALVLNPGDKEAGRTLVKLWQNQVSRIPSANSHLGLARAHQLTGDLQSAQAEYKQVVRLDPNHPYLPAARHSFKLALARSEAAKNIATARGLESQGLLRDAFHKVNEAVKLSPGDIGNRIYQGELLERLGQPEQSRRVYQAILKDDPANPIVSGKLKALPVAAAPGPTSLAGHPAGFPGTKFPTLLPDAAAQAAVAAAPALVAAAPGAVPGDHVSTLSNFLGDLRSHMVTSKAQTEKVEDVAQKVMKSLTAGDEAPATAGGAAGIAESLRSGGGDDYIEKILKSPVGSALPGQEAEALAAPPAKLLPGATPPVAPSTAAQAAAAPPVAPPFTPTAGGPVQAAPQFSAAPDSVSAFPPTPTAGVATPAGQTTPAPAGFPSFLPGGFGDGPQLPTSPAFAPAAPVTSPPAPAIGPAAFAPNSAGDSLRPPITDPGQLRPAVAPTPLRFELKAIRPGLTEVQLKVVLRNESQTPFTLPSDYKTIIKHADSREAEVKTAFKSKVIPPGGIAEGTVHVPLNHVDPYADLVMRNVFAAGSGSPDLHLVTSISQK